ncbi:MAG: DUF4388 domain-containing protein [Candidatus Obscuribacter sp.]|nr:DUF4388 domain-containing protein [Candidatus Obscuribacter sp.]
MTGQPSFRPSRPLITGVPREEDLLVLHELAKNTRGIMVEQPFDLGTGIAYCLQTVVGRRAGEEDPTWYLYSGPTKTKLEWILQTSDINMVLTSLMPLALARPEAGAKASPSTSATNLSAQSEQNNSITGRPSDSQTRLTAERPKILDPVAALNIRGPQPSTSMEGDLSRLSIDSVLQSISKGKMTGRLECQVRGEKIEVIFENGNARHASTPLARGEEALIELMTALEGTFRFVPSVSTEPRSIFRRTEELTDQAKSLIDFGTYLERVGIKLNTRLSKTNTNMTEQEFENAVAPLVPLSVDVQKRFYQLVDNQSALMDIVERGKFNRCQWIPALYNLVAGSIVTIGEEMQNLFSPTGSYSIGIDRSTVEQFARSHIYSETGIVTFVALLYFIEQEYYRFECFHSPFALVMIKPRIRRPPDPHLPGIAADAPIVDINQRNAILKAITDTKRKADLLAHFQQDDFALLLPQTSAEGVRAFAGRVMQALKPGFGTAQQVDLPELGLLPGEKLVLTMGIGSLPEECQDWVKLLAFLNQNQRRFE